MEILKFIGAMVLVAVITFPIGYMVGGLIGCICLKVNVKTFMKYTIDGMRIFGKKIFK